MVMVTVMVMVMVMASSVGWILDFPRLMLRRPSVRLVIELDFEGGSETGDHHVVADQQDQSCDIPIRQELTDCREGRIRNSGIGNAFIDEAQHSSDITGK